MFVLIMVVLALFGLMRILANARANISNYQEDIYHATQDSIRQAHRKTRREQERLGFSDTVAARRFEKRANHLSKLHNAHIYGGSDQTPIGKQKGLQAQTKFLKGKLKKRSKVQAR